VGDAGGGKEGTVSGGRFLHFISKCQLMYWMGIVNLNNFNKKKFFCKIIIDMQKWEKKSKMSVTKIELYKLC